MVTVHCVATLPVVVPDGVEMRFLNDMEHMTFQVLEYFSHAQIDLDEFGTVCPRAYLPEGPSTSELVPIIWKEAVLRLLRLDFDVEIAGIETGWDEVSEESTRSASEFLAMKIGKVLNDIVVAANIASPGSLSTSGGQVTVGGLAGTPVPPLNGWTIRDGLLTSEGYGWPTMVRLPFGKVWKWLHRQPGFHSGFSDDSTSRALIAFTNVMTSADLMQLFWAVLGLESLFVPEEGA